MDDATAVKPGLSSGLSRLAVYCLASFDRERFGSRFTGFEISGIGLSEPDVGLEDEWGVSDEGCVVGAEMDGTWDEDDEKTVFGV